MSLASNGSACHGRQTARPTQSLDAGVLDTVLAQIALPQTGATAGWRHPRRRRIVEAIAAYNPTDGIQATLVAQIISARLQAEDTRRLAAAPDVTTAQAGALRRTIGTLARSVAWAEHLLRRARGRAGSRGGAAGRSDLLAVDAAGRGDAT